MDAAQTPPTGRAHTPGLSVPRARRLVRLAPWLSADIRGTVSSRPPAPLPLCPSFSMSFRVIQRTLSNEMALGRTGEARRARALGSSSSGSKGAVLMGAHERYHSPPLPDPWPPTPESASPAGPGLADSLRLPPCTLLPQPLPANLSSSFSEPVCAHADPMPQPGTHTFMVYALDATC